MGLFATNLTIPTLPFLFSDEETAWKFMDSSFMERINTDAAREGKINGTQTTITNFYNGKLYKIHHCFALTNHVYNPVPLIIRSSLWNSLSEADRQVILEAAVHA